MASTVNTATGELRVTLSGTPDTCLQVVLPDWTEWATIQSQAEDIKFSLSGTDGGSIGAHYGIIAQGATGEMRFPWRPGAATTVSLYLESAAASAVAYVKAERGGGR